MSSSRSAGGHRLHRRGVGPIGLTFWIVLTLTVGAWTYVALSHHAGSVGLAGTSSAWEQILNFLRALSGYETPMSPNPPARPFHDAAGWWRMARLAYETLAMSVLAIWVAIAGMLLTVVAGARPRGEAAVSMMRRCTFAVVRGGWIIARAVPELVWALLLVFVLQPGVLAGALALGIHNFGIVGKLCSEVIEDLDRRPVRALRASGAGRFQVFLYAVLPQVLPQFLTYSLYRWEVIIRTTIVVGFVAAGGLGREFRLAMSFFHFTDITMILATYLVLVIGVDLTAAGLRKLAR